MGKNKKEGKHKESKSAQDDARLDYSEENKRLNRVIGQIEGIKKMLESERRPDDIIIQCKAVHSALRSIESRILNQYLDHSLHALGKADKRKDRQEVIDDLLDLYKYA